MRATASVSERLRAQLADLKMAGAIEALDERSSFYHETSSRQEGLIRENEMNPRIRLSRPLDHHIQRCRVYFSDRACMTHRRRPSR
jgi:hypothetical protein